MNNIVLGKCLTASPIQSISGEFLPEIFEDLGHSYTDFISTYCNNYIKDKIKKEVIEYSFLVNLLQGAAEFTGCEHFGVLLGQAGSMASLGPLYHHALNAPTVRAALSGIDAEFRSQHVGAITELTCGDAARLSYIIIDPAIDSSAVISDAAMAIAMRIIAQLCGPGWKPELIELARREPADCRPYRRLFKCPIAFNSTTAAIHFGGAWLDRPLAAGCAPSTSLRSIAPENSHTPGVTERVILQLTRSISTGAIASEGEVARGFGVCGRTLQRELTKARTSYRSLSDEVRFGVAKRLLNDTDLPVTEIALAVGYADVSVLTRAFTRWAGTCPSEWRSGTRPRSSDRMPPGDEFVAPEDIRPAMPTEYLPFACP